MDVSQKVSCEAAETETAEAVTPSCFHVLLTRPPVNFRKVAELQDGSEEVHGAIQQRPTELSWNSGQSSHLEDCGRLSPCVELKSHKEQIHMWIQTVPDTNRDFPSQIVNFKSEFERNPQK